MNYGIILAAGKGSRMNNELPKCSIPILGKPMILYQTDVLNKLNLKTICVLGYKKDKMLDIIPKDVLIAIQEEQLGTADAVKSCKNFISDKKGYSIIIPGDVPLIDEEILSTLISSHLTNNNDLSIVSVNLNDPFGYGRIIKDNNSVKIVEEIELTEVERKIKEVNTGIYCINNDLLFMALDLVKNDNAKKEFYLTDIAKILSDLGKKVDVVSFRNDYRLRGVNNLKQLSIIENYLQKQIINKHLNNGVRIENNVMIGPDVVIKKSAYIKSGSIILGNSLIFEGAVIGPNSQLTNAIIGQNSIINQSMVFDSKVGNNATVGPFSHLRMYTVIGDNDRIGNFVEIKNSSLGVKTNVAHLTYIGDTSCGSGVNFGCGTITINYDGKNKYRTNIGDNVFIGCNSNLVAPLWIGSNTFIAAGSTVTDNLDEGDFTIARSKQITKKGYAKKYGYKKYLKDQE